MRKKILIILLIIFIPFIFVLSRIKFKQPYESIINKNYTENNQKINTYKRPVNVTKNGTDYLMSQLNDGKFGSKIVVTIIGEGPKTFNPWDSRDNTSTEITSLMFDGLLTTDAISGEVIPKLAKEIDISHDMKKYRIKLRRGIKWTNGEEITSDDVYYTWSEIIFKGLGNPSTRDSLYIDGKLPTIKKIDKYTLEFETSKPFAPFLRTLSSPIANKKQIEKELKNNKDFNLIYSSTVKPITIVSNGPFILEEYVPAQRVVLKRNPNYYYVNSKYQTLPYIDKYIFQIVADQNTEVLKFQSNESDILNLNGYYVSKFIENQKNSDYTVYNLGPTTSTLFLTFNLNTRKDKNGKFYVDRKKQKWFGNKNFRKAVDYAVDREAIIYNVASGVGAPLFTPESLSSIYLNKEVAQGHKCDINKSRELLKKEGFVFRNGNLYDNEGNLVEFELLTNAGNLEREIIGVMVKQNLSEIGIKVNFKPIEFNTLVNRIINVYNWEVIILGLTGNPLEPHSGKNVWYSDGALHIFNKRDDNKSNDLLPFEKRLDQIFNEASLKLEFEQRKKLYDEYQKIIYDEKPIIYLYSPLSIVAVRNHLKNIYPTPLGGVLHNIQEIFVEY